MWLLNAKCQRIIPTIRLIELYVGNTTNSRRNAGGNGTCRQMGLGNGYGFGIGIGRIARRNWSTSGMEWSVAESALASERFTRSCVFPRLTKCTLCRVIQCGIPRRGAASAAGMPGGRSGGIVVVEGTAPSPAGSIRHGVEKCETKKCEEKISPEEIIAN